jgi:hypothetical protein
VVRAVRWRSVVADLPQIPGRRLSGAVYNVGTMRRCWGHISGWKNIASEDALLRAVGLNRLGQVTGGNCDDGSLLTLLVCVAYCRTQNV